jgi:glutamate/tyrosine decarboxylase-like PLP-dependent enzyme
MVVATAGTTGAGAIDPLRDLADLCARERLWLHVDAAWGGSALLSPRLRPLLAGIESADSVTWDAHKWLSVPVGAGMFFCRWPDAIGRTFHVSGASYVPPNKSAALDPYTTTIQWSRRFIGLKVFMALAEAGADHYAKAIEHHAEMGDRLRASLEAAGWIVVNDSRLAIVCFTHSTIRDGRCSARQIVDAVNGTGRAWLSDVALTVLGVVLRACVTSYWTDEDDVRALVEELQRARKRLTT